MFATAQQTGCVYWTRLVDAALERLSWADAVAQCESYSKCGEQASLALPVSAAEANFLRAAFHPDRVQPDGRTKGIGSPNWILSQGSVNGGYNVSTGGFTYAISNDDDKFTPYAEGFWQTVDGFEVEPNSEPSRQTCLAQGYQKKKADLQPSRINDADCSNRFEYVCQLCPRGDGCPIGYQAAVTRTLDAGIGEADRCEECKPGFFGSAEAVCSPCPKGTYNDQLGAISCTPCPAGTSTLTLGSVFEIQCSSLFTTTTTTTTTTTPEAPTADPLRIRTAAECKEAPCGSDCALLPGCGWSSSIGECRKGATTTNKEMDLCVSDEAATEAYQHTALECKAAPCGSSCKLLSGCGWSTAKMECRKGGSTGEHEELMCRANTVNTTAADCKLAPCGRDCNLLPGCGWSGKRMECRKGGSTTSNELDECNPLLTTTAVPEVQVPLECTDPAGELAEVQARLSHIGRVVAAMSTRASGRSEAIATSCKDKCSGIEFGAGCMPCAVSGLTTEDECTSPGPFGTGILCHARDGKKIVPEVRCCDSNAAAATCTQPADACDCGTIPTSSSIGRLISRHFDVQTRVCSTL